MRNVVLIGFMGAGKTAVGKSLAQHLSSSFIDTDHLIEKRTGKQIKEIFAEQGEEAFRKLETETVKEVSEKEDQVIAVGGGAVLREENVQALKKNGVLVYLKADLAILFERTKGTQKRPLLEVPSPKEEIERLLSIREGVYQEVADIIIDTSALSVPEVVSEVEGEIGRENPG